MGDCQSIPSAIIRYVVGGHGQTDFCSAMSNVPVTAFPDKSDAWPCHLLYKLFQFALLGGCSWWQNAVVHLLVGENCFSQHQCYRFCIDYSKLSGTVQSAIFDLWWPRWLGPSTLRTILKRNIIVQFKCHIWGSWRFFSQQKMEEVRS